MSAFRFEWLSREQAAKSLAQFEGPRAAARTAENHLDRIAAMRRLQPVTTAEERASARAYNDAHARPNADAESCAS